MVAGVNVRLAAFVLIVVALVSCNGSSGGSGGLVNIPTTTANFSDTSSDGTGPGTPWDITQVATTRATNNPTVLFVSVTYSQNVQNALPAPGTMPSATQLGTYVVFIGPSGTFSVTGCGFTYNNVAFIVDGGGIGGRLADGNYGIYNMNTFAMTGEATVNVSANAILYTIPLSALNGTSVPQLFVGSNNDGNNPSDCDPTPPALLTW